MSKTKEKTKKNNKNNILIILILILIGLAGIMGGYSLAISESKSAVLVEVPTINTSLSSSSDNTTHSIQIKYSLEMDRKTKNSTSIDNLFVNLKEVTSGLDFSKVKAENGINYIKGEVKNKLDIPPEKITGIYITELLTDAKVPENADVDPRFKNERQEKVFKSLFPNMR